MLLPFGGKVPRDEGAVFVAPNATVLGDVVLGPGSSVWYGAVLRGDDGTLTLGENTNVQDNAVLHCDPGGAVTLGKNVTVGHCALVHGLDGHFVCGQTGQDKGQGQRCGQQQGRRPAEESRVLHKRILQRKLPASLNQKLKHYIKEYHK